MHMITGPAHVATNAQETPTACTLCTHNCGLLVDVANNEIVGVKADTTNPITHGYSCNKGYTIGHYVRHAQRTQYPLKRKPDGSFERISWNQAIDEIAAKLNKILKAHPARAVAMAGVGGMANHLDGYYAVPFLMGTGSPMLFNSLAQEKTQHALLDRWMFAAPSNCYFHPDADRSNYILLIGTNPAISNRGHNATEMLRHVRADERRTLVVVDPKRTESARRANMHLAIKPGTDAFLLLGLAAYIVREDLTDTRFLRRNTSGFDSVAPILRNIDPAQMAERAGIAPADLATVARGFATAPSACIFNDLGSEQIPYSTLVAYLIRVVLLLTGNVGNTGGNVFQGMFGLDNTALLSSHTPAKALVSGIEAIPMIIPMGMFPPNILAEEILADHPARIRALIVEGANPLVSYADTHKLTAAFAKLELLVVVDPAFTETAQMADYVLPTPVGYEKWEYSAFPKRYPEISAHLRPPIVRGPEEALPESEIYYRLARAMGLVEKAPRLLHRLAKYARTPAGAAAFMAALMSAAVLKSRSIRNTQRTVPRIVFWLYETLGQHLSSPSLAMMWLITQSFALARKDAVARVFPEVQTMRNRFSVGEFLFHKLLHSPNGLHVGKLDERRNFADHCRRNNSDNNGGGGKANLFPKAMAAEIQRALADPFAVDEEYPFILAGGMRTSWNANSVQRNPAWRKGKGPHCPAVMHPDDAAKMDLKTGDMVRVETRRGSAEAPVSIDTTTLPGHIHIPNGFGQAYPDAETGELKRVGVRINELTDAADRDPFTGCPHHKYIRCRVTALSRQR